MGAVLPINRRILAAVAAGVVALGTATLTTTSASAASGPTSLPAGQYTLSADYHRFDTVDDALVSTLGTAAVHTVMDHANHDRTAITDSLGIAGYQGGFGFDSPDNDDCTNYPQGITSSRDAVGTADSGNYDGHQLILVSWYTTDGCGGAQTRNRITLVDWDATYPNKYKKILLVEPTGTAAEPNFTDITGHAGGVSWYGDYLYLADTVPRHAGVQHAEDPQTMDAGGASDQIGRQSDGSYYAHDTRTSCRRSARSRRTPPPARPWPGRPISLDRVSGSFVMGEYTCSSGCTSYPNRAGRAIRFPFEAGATTFAATTTASQALQLPWYKINGVASHNGRWWFNSSGAKQLYYWTPTTGATAPTWVSAGESISYWEDDTNPDELWSLQETRGHRDVFAVTQATYGS